MNIPAMLVFSTAFSLTPFAKITALSFTAPILMAILAALVFGEGFSIYRWGAMVAGFIGMEIILSSGFIPIDTGALFVIRSAALWAVAMISSSKSSLN